jgi:hypothetical protein
MLLLASLALLACSDDKDDSPPATVMPTRTPTPIRTPIPTPTRIPTLTRTPTPTRTIRTPDTVPDDVDKDGVTAKKGDCDDTNAAVYPGAKDPICDGIDNDCDGATEVALIDKDVFYFLQEAWTTRTPATSCWYVRSDEGGFQRKRASRSSPTTGPHDDDPRRGREDNGARVKSSNSFILRALTIQNGWDSSDSGGSAPRASDRS